VKNTIKAAAKTDLFAFFLYKALDFLVPGGRIGFVTSSSWLTADFGTPIKKLLLDRLRLVAVVSSSAESFFSQVDINTTLLVAELRDKPGIDKEEMLRFVTLKKRISEIFPPGKDYWARIIPFMDTIESATTSIETEDFRLTMIPAAIEKRAHSNKQNLPRNWSLYLRAPASYFQLFGDNA
jgi:hypothetical protein